MASINTTITLQAASDSIMTIDNAGGTALADDDCRKVYGLPHTYVARPSLKGADGKPMGKEITRTIGRHVVTYHAGENKLLLNQAASQSSGQVSGDGFSAGARWDQISPVDIASQRSILKSIEEVNDFPTAAYTGGYGLSDVSITDVFQQACSGFSVDRRPKTTAFQLHCDTLTHISQDMTAITPLPGVEWGDDVTSGTPEQMSNIAVGLGFRQEKLSLGGVLIDRGLVSASNPRRQVLLNIARTQYLKVRNAAPPQSEKEGGFLGFTLKGGSKFTGGMSIGRVEDPPPRGRQHAWGGLFAGPTNPRSYPCLTIHNQDYDASEANTYHDPGDGTNWRPPTGDVEADGGYKIYRGMITQISFSMEPGRPDFWRWSMDFSVIANEKRALGALGDPVDFQDVNEDSAN